MNRLRFAVIPTKDRPDDFRDCYNAIAPQVDHVIIVAHGAPYAELYGPCGDVSIEWWRAEQPNISAMWNIGLHVAEKIATLRGRLYDVAVLNDDAIVPVGWFADVTREMHEEGTAAGCMNPEGPYLLTSPGPVDLRRRMTGYAFILNGDAGLRADEDLVWWYSDDSLDWKARERGGVAVVKGQVEHRHPSVTTVGELAVIAGQDRERFAARWGRTPW